MKNKKTKLQILYEDNHLIVINKPAGILVQGDKTGDEPLTEYIKKYLKKKYNKPGNVFLGLPHRLDRPTSGVLVLAKTSKALTRLNKIFQNNEAKKIYWAIVDKKPPKNTDILEHYLKKNQQKNKSFAYEKPIKGSKKAILEYKLKAKSDHYYLLEITLHTGRHHQIRAQLAKIGIHIKGDLKYGARRSNPDGSIALHARSISFIHPVKKEPMTFIAPVPEDKLWKFFENKIAQKRK